MEVERIEARKRGRRDERVAQREARKGIETALSVVYTLFHHDLEDVTTNTSNKQSTPDEKEERENSGRVQKVIDKVGSKYALNYKVGSNFFLDL